MCVYNLSKVSKYGSAEFGKNAQIRQKEHKILCEVIKKTFSYQHQDPRVFDCGLSQKQKLLHYINHFLYSFYPSSNLTIDLMKLDKNHCTRFSYRILNDSLARQFPLHAPILSDHLTLLKKSLHCALLFFNKKKI
jgi:hypothetical protein